MQLPPCLDRVVEELARLIYAMNLIICESRLERTIEFDFVDTFMTKRQAMHRAGFVNKSVSVYYDTSEIEAE